MAVHGSPWRRQIYDRLAAISRAAPSVRGKGRLGWAATRLLASEPSAEVVRLKSGVQLRLDVSERFQSWIYWTGEYDEPTISRMLGLLPPRATVFDVGANIGAYVTQIGYRLGPQSSLIAIEPRPANLDRLRDNLRLNGLEARTHVIPDAVGESPGRTWIKPIPGREALTSDGAIAAEGEGGVPVEMVTLDDVASRIGLTACDLIKLDIQGCELAALKGARRLLSTYHPVLFLEFSEYWMRRFGWTTADLLAYLEPLGYRLQRDDGSPITAASRSRRDAENVWAFPGNPAAASIAPL